MEEARRLYEVLNKELHEELPALYDSRIPFFVNTFQTLFSSEAQFHQEYSKVYSQLAELIELLATEASKGTYQSDANRYFSQSPYSLKANSDGNQHHKVAALPASPSLPDSPSSKPLYEEHNDSSHVSDDVKEANTSPVAAQRVAHSNGDHEISNSDANDSSAPVLINITASVTVSHRFLFFFQWQNHKTEKKTDELFEIPIGATTKDLPAGVLYKVTNFCWLFYSLTFRGIIFLGQSNL